MHIYTHIHIYMDRLTHIKQSVLIEKSFSHLNVFNSNIMKLIKHRYDTDKILKMVISHCKETMLNTKV